MALTVSQGSELLTKITTDKERILNNFQLLDGSGTHLKGESASDVVDQASSDYERSQLLRFRNRDLFYVKKLEKALAKISDEEYGTCEECDMDIKFERLLARPTAELCITCKDDAEREERGNYIARQSKTKEVTTEFSGAR
jgi:DnaK suppressor protein